MKHPLICILLALLPFVSQAQTEDEQARKALAFLLSAQDSTGEFRDSLNPLFNVWETIIVTDALLEELSADDPVIQRAIAWLKTNENDQGLICHNSNCRESYCLETSALYLPLLANTSYTEINMPDAAIAAMQEPNGSWKIGNPDVTGRLDFPSVTAFALNFFRNMSGYNDAYDRKAASYDRSAALLYLAAQQQPDGSFGKSWEYYNCVGYTFWQCFAMLGAYHETADAYAKAEQYIYTHQLPDGSWNDTDQPTNHISPELQTVFMLLALLDDGQQYGEQFRKGMAYLRSRQLPNGSWDGGLFPIPKEQYKKREYLITTALAYKLLVRAAKND